MYLWPEYSTTADNDNNNNLNDNKYEKKTKNKHGGFGLQVLLAVLMMLVAGVTPAWAQSQWKVNEV